MSQSPFKDVPAGIADPILGLNDLFRADSDDRKVNLGVGVYQDRHGKSPLLKVVVEATKRVTQSEDTKSYLPIEGFPAYNKCVQELLFGAESEVIASSRAVTLQCVGGSGALKVGADFIHRFQPSSRLFVSDPSWENHRALFEAAGFTVETYPYYDARTNGLRFSEMLERIRSLPARSTVLLHACCHNPTGVDLTDAQWDELIPVLVNRELIPFLDLAYQGFGRGLTEDVYAVRALAKTRSAFVVASSFSKSFSMYRERVGALTVVTPTAEEASRVLAQTKRVVRTIYSSPPAFGGQVIANVLGDPELRAGWELELKEMRDRIWDVRRKFRKGLEERVPGRDFSFIEQQCGMFSYSGLSMEVIHHLREVFHVYALDSGRICVAALNEKNLPYVCDSIASSIQACER